MRKVKLDPRDIFDEVDRGLQYKQSDGIDLFETVKRNEAFYTGDQWRGLSAKTPDLLLVTANFLQRVCAMLIAKVASDDVAAKIEHLQPTKENEKIMKTIAREVDAAYERIDLKKQNRKHIRNAAVDADTCAYFWFDADAPTGQMATGTIRSEIIENINVIFGNPHDRRVEIQPYIIVLQRKPVDEVREEAEENGVPEDLLDQIRAESDDHQEERGSENSLVTVAVKLYRAEDGHIHCVKATHNVTIREDWDLELNRYPIAWMSWEELRNSYHGRAAITGLIPNQIAINATYSSIMSQIRNTSFAKLIYSDRVREWDPSPTKAIKVTGEIDVTKVATYLQGAAVNPSIVNVMDALLSLTRDCMGASDATMGDVRPDNAAAIIALQTADNYPVEMHRMEYNDFVEAQVRIIVDMMRAYYGTRQVAVEDIDENDDPSYVLQEFDFSTLTDENYMISVQIGTSTYWSETMQVETLNNIFTSGIMQDPDAFLLFLDVMPDKYIPHKQKLIDYAKKQQLMLQQGQQPAAGQYYQNGYMPSDVPYLPQ